jgi:diketogulonate reductase-like aldo/keto reductase
VCWFLLEMAKAIPFFELNTGAKIPSVGLGTGGADPGAVAVADAVTAAIKVFYSCPKFF